MKKNMYDPSAYGGYMKKMQDNRLERYTTRYNLADVISDERKNRKRFPN